MSCAALACVSSSNSLRDEAQLLATGASGNRSCPCPTAPHNASAQPANPNRTIQPRITLLTNDSPLGWDGPPIFSYSLTV